MPRHETKSMSPMSPTGGKWTPPATDEIVSAPKGAWTPPEGDVITGGTDPYEPKGHLGFSPTKLNPEEEVAFQTFWDNNAEVTEWRKQMISTYGEEPDKDNPDYDYRGAFKSGDVPKITPEDGAMHWGSFGVDGKHLKSEEHPTRDKADLEENSDMLSFQNDLMGGFAPPMSTDTEIVPRQDQLVARDKEAENAKKQDLDFFNKWEEFEGTKEGEVSLEFSKESGETPSILDPEGTKVKTPATLDAQAYALKHMEVSDPERLKNVQAEFKGGKFSERQEVALTREGMQLKRDALNIKGEEMEKELSQKVGELFQQAGLVTGNIEQDIAAQDDFTKTQLANEPEFHLLQADYEKLEKDSEEFVENDYPEIAKKAGEDRVDQLITDIMYETNTDFRYAANVSSPVLRGLTGIITDVASLPGVDLLSRHILDPFLDDNKEELSEITSKWVDDLNNMIAPVPSRVLEGRGVFEDMAQVTIDGDDLSVVFEGDEIVDVRTSGGRSIGGDIRGKAIAEYKKNPTKIESQADEGLLFNRVATSLVDISLLMFTTRKITKGFSMLTSSEKLAQTAGLFTTNFVFMNDDFYTQARENGLSEGQSLTFSIASAITTTAAMQLSPGKFIFAKKFPTEFTTKYSKLLLDKGFTHKEAMKQTLLSGSKEALNFNIFVASLALADNTTKYVSNIVLGSDFEFEAPTLNQIKEDLLVNTLTGFIIGLESGSINKQKSRLMNDALFSAAMEKDTFIPIVKKRVEEGKMDAEMGNKIIEKVETLWGKLGSIPKDITDRSKSEMLSLMEEKIRLQVENGNETLGEAYKKANEKRLEEIDNSLTDIINKVEDGTEAKKAEKEKDEKEKADIIAKGEGKKDSKKEDGEKKIGDLLKLNKFSTGTESAWGEVVETDASGKVIRRETLTREQFEAEQERKGKPEEGKAVDGKTESKDGRPEEKGEGVKLLKKQEAIEKEILELEEDAFIKDLDIKKLEDDLVGLKEDFDMAESKSEKDAIDKKILELEEDIFTAKAEKNDIDSKSLELEEDLFIAKGDSKSEKKTEEKAEVIEPTDKVGIEKAMMDVFSLPKEMARAVGTVYDAVAEAWAKANNTTKDQWYKKKIKKIQKGKINGKDVLFQDTEIGDQWYSSANKTLESIPQEKGAAQIMLSKLKKGEGIKKSEAEWIGLDTFLAENPKATKTEIRDFLHENRIEVKEVIHTELTEAERDKAHSMTEWELIHEEGGKEVWVAESDISYRIEKVEPSVAKAESGNERAIYEVKAKMPGQEVFENFDNFETIQEAKSSIETHELETVDTADAGTTRFKAYSLDGAKEGTYTELLITMPNNLSAKAKKKAEGDSQKITSDLAKGQAELKKLNEEKTNLRKEEIKLEEEAHELIGYKLSNTTIGGGRQFDAGTLVTRKIRALNEKLKDVRNNRDYEKLVKEIDAEYEKQKVLSSEFLKISNRLADIEFQKNKLGNERTNLERELNESHAADYHSSHFNARNIVAHVRKDQRTDKDGNVVEHIAEIQSDYHQEGRKKGYRSPETREKIRSGVTHKVRGAYASELLKAPPEQHTTQVISVETGGSVVPTVRSYFIPEGKTKGKFDLVLNLGVEGKLLRGEKAKDITMEEAIELAKDLVTEEHLNRMDAVPDNPFKKNWHELVVKRVLRDAAEKGTDRVTWDTGKTNADRYNLSNQIDSLQYSKNSDGTYTIRVIKQGRVMDKKVGMPAKDIEGYVGKEVAEKIIKNEGLTKAEVDKERSEKVAELEKEADRLSKRGEDLENIDHDASFEAFEHASEIEREITELKRLDGEIGGEDRMTLGVKDLTVGGEGMVRFYDEVLPKFFAKYGKKYGATVGKVNVGNRKTDQFGVTGLELKEAGLKEHPFSQRVDWLDEAQTKARVQVIDTRTNDVIKTFEGKFEEIKKESDAFASKELDKLLNGVEAWSFDITPEMRNYLLEGQPLFQHGRAAVKFDKDGRAIIAALTNPNVSSPMHELSHVFERDLATEQQKTVLDWAGEKTFNTNAKEKFARGFEKFLAEGKVENKKLEKVFEQFREWLEEIYKGVIKHKGKEIVLTPEMRDIFNQVVREVIENKETPKPKDTEGSKETPKVEKEKVQKLPKTELQIVKERQDSVAELNKQIASEKSGKGGNSSKVEALIEKRNKIEVQLEESGIETRPVTSKLDIKTGKEIAKEKEDSRKVIDETQEEKEVKEIEENETVDTLEDARQEIKDEKIRTPQQLKEKMDAFIDNIRKEKAKKDGNAVIKDISDKVLDDIEKKSGEAKSMAELVKQFERLNAEVGKVAKQEVKKALLKAIKKQLTMTKAQKAKLSPFVNAELKKFKSKSTFKDPESLRVQKIKKTLEWRRENPELPLPEGVLRELEDLDRQNLHLLSNEKLKEVLDDIKLLKTQGKTFNQLKVAQRQREADALIKDFENVITGGRGIDEKGRVVPEARKTRTARFQEAAKLIVGTIALAGSHIIPLKPILTAKWVQDAMDIAFLKKHLNTNNMLDILDENAKGTPYQGKILKAMRNIVNTARKNQLNDVQQKTLKLDTKLRELGLQGSLQKLVEVDGDTFTRDQLIRIYMSEKDPGQKKSMLDQKAGNKYEQQFLDLVKHELSDVERAYGDWLIDFYEEMFPELNKVFRNSNFVDLTRNPFFSPMLKEKDMLNKTESLNIQGMHSSGEARSAIDPSFTKERSGSSAAIDFTKGATDVMMEYITRAAHYKAFEMPLQELNTVIHGIKDAVIQEHGKEHYELLEQWVKDIANDGRYTAEGIQKFAKSLRIGFTKGVLGLNLVTAMKQVVSGTSYLTELGEKDFVTGVADYWMNKKARDEWIDNTVPIVRDRGGSMDRDMKDSMNLRDQYDKLLNPMSISTTAMNPIRAMDGYTVRSGFVAAYKSKGGKFTGEPNAEAIDYALGLMERTQPRGDIKDLSAFQKGSEMTKLLTMFMNQPNQYYNIIYSNMRAYSKGRIGKGQLARAMVYGWIVPTLMFETIAKGFTPDDDDLLSNVMSAPLRNVFFLGNMIEAARTGFDYTASPMEGLLNDIVLELKHLSQGEIQKSMVNLALLTAQARGLPINQLSRSVGGVYDLLNDPEESDLRRLIWSKWALKDDDEKEEGIGTPTFDDKDEIDSAEELGIEDMDEEKK